MAKTYKLSIEGNITVGGTISGTTLSDGTLLTNISSPTINVAVDTEELDIIATGSMKAYAVGRKDVTVAFTFKAIKDGAALDADITAVAAAYAAGTALNVSITDTAVGNIIGPFVVTKFDENRAAGKVISYAVEMKPTYDGTCVAIS